LPFNRVAPHAVAAVPAREAPIRVAISFPDRLCRAKAAASCFPTKFPKAALPLLGIDLQEV